MKGLSCTDSLLYILSTTAIFGKWTVVYSVQLNFSAVFDGISHDGFIFTLRLIYVCLRLCAVHLQGAGCREFVSYSRQRVMVNELPSERIPIVCGVPQGSVLGPFLFILYNSEMFDLVDNRLLVYAEHDLQSK